nr:ribonuclease H-like domain, reverse transcriptase, RNA-dependent DNA polymerase [Tanacetum cinerariifolium]
MQEELLQIKMQKVWVLVDLTYGKRAIGFEDPDHPDKVYKVVKALYGLHQAPRALTMQVVLSGLESLEMMLHATTILSAGYLTTKLMVLNSPCLTHIKNWLVQIKRSLAYVTAVSLKVSAVWSDEINAARLVLLGHQFWTTINVKKVNDVMRLQALVDKKKVVVTKATIRDVLRLDDAEGVECLPNEEIFAALARMGYEKPSTKLTFYKAFFSSQ